MDSFHAGLDAHPDTGSLEEWPIKEEGEIACSDIEIMSPSFVENEPLHSDSDEDDQPAVATEDLIDVLQKVDEIDIDHQPFRKIVPYDPVKRPDIRHVVPLGKKRSKWVLTLRRIFNRDYISSRSTSLDVGSELITNLLMKIPLGEKAMLESTGSINWPDDDIFRYREDIKALASSFGELAVKHVDVLLRLIEDEYATQLKTIKELFPKATSNFEVLRDLFRDDDMIVNRQGTRAYCVVAAHIVIGHNMTYLSIKAEYVDFHGYGFGTVVDEFQIGEFLGIKYITDLPVFPLKYFPDVEGLSQRLRKRGQKFASLLGQHFKIHGDSRSRHKSLEMRGQCHYDPEDQMDDDSVSGASLIEWEEDALHTIARVVVDVAAFNRFESHRAIRSKSLKKQLVQGNLTDQQLLICTDKVPVFSMLEKNFYKAPVDEIHDIIFNEEVFDQLVIPASTKDLIRALVESHVKGSGMDDFVRGKGQGLIILLHGPPGVGKTMTAEAVAELTRRPLYVATSGELGDTAASLEHNLKKILDLAKTFGAVLLLDEADVFVEERTPQDLYRNALVSIFLRELEYYRGILFLTTNRAQTFDHAFQSRIHLSIKYSDLDAPSRERIWRAFGDHVTGGLRVSAADYAELATWDLNGRQIKNVISASKALASNVGDEISMDCLRTVFNIVGGSQPQV